MDRISLGLFFLRSDDLQPGINLSLRFVTAQRDDERKDAHASWCEVEILKWSEGSRGPCGTLLGRHSWRVAKRSACQEAVTQLRLQNA